MFLNREHENMNAAKPTAMYLDRLQPPPLKNAYVNFGNNFIQGVVGRIGNYYDELTQRERSIISGSWLKRTNEFSTGRYFARTLLTGHGYSDVCIGTGAQRNPLWPGGIVGSISHSDKIAVVLVSKNEEIDGIGVDLEYKNRVTEQLHDMVLTTREKKIAHQNVATMPDMATLLFSAKESVYKALNPRVGLMIEYDEVSIQLDVNNQGFYAEYLGGRYENCLMEQGVGCYMIYEEHYLCIFVLPDLKNESSRTGKPGRHD